MDLQIPFLATPLFSHLYKTPGCHPHRSQISTGRCCTPMLYPRQSKMVHNPRAGLARPAAREVCVSKPSATSDRPWSSTAPPGEFRPYIPPEQTLAEFTIRAVVLGALFGLLFGAVTVYVGLRAGLTVSASIPISVLSISILRAFGRSTILENNIVQTTGSAGESLAAGVMFTIPALIFLGFGSEFTFWRIFPLALLGGWLGVLFMVPLRRQLIVKEHGNLIFPEGTACADVLVAGERGGSFAGRVFWGLGLGGVYTFLMNTVQAWTSQPEGRPTWFPGASFRAAITSEYLGVGYIIGPRVSGILFAGVIISWLVMMPAINLYSQLAGNRPIYPSTIPIPRITPDVTWPRAGRLMRWRGRFSLRYCRGAHQRPARQFFKSHQRPEDRNSDGLLRDFLPRRMDRGELRRPRAHDWWRGVHCCRHRGRHLAGFENRLSRRRHAILAADGSSRWRHRFHCRHRRNPESDEQGLGEVHPHAHSRQHPGFAIRRENRARFVHLPKQELRSDQFSGLA